MKNKKLQEDFKYAIKNCYSNDKLNDLHNLFVEFVHNTIISSTKEFINNKSKDKK